MGGTGRHPDRVALVLVRRRAGHPAPLGPAQVRPLRQLPPRVQVDLAPAGQPSDRSEFEGLQPALSQSVAEPARRGRLQGRRIRLIGCHRGLARGRFIPRRIGALRAHAERGGRASGRPVLANWSRFPQGGPLIKMSLLPGGLTSSNHSRSAHYPCVQLNWDRTPDQLPAGKGTGFKEPG